MVSVVAGLVVVGCLKVVKMEMEVVVVVDEVDEVICQKEKVE